ncbi:ribose-phosphate pyrophosphokinase [Candidatus Bathyarchaeota archaeon]|nr:ribose-phosphate pyrophosphokinase [Candidatus Bathyarchaeota archaeon]
MTNFIIFTGSANPSLAEAVTKQLDVRLGNRILQRFPDGELHIEIEESVRGQDVYLIQPISPPVDEHLMELLLLADACRRAGATQLTAIVPYLGYARQDRRARGREPVSARLVADLIKTSGIQRLVAVDLHTTALEGIFTVPLEHLSAVSILSEAVRPWIEDNTLVVSPDLGAIKLAERYARLLQLPVAIAYKTRISGEEVHTKGIIGDVHDRAVLIVDDMISTGGTVKAAIEALLEAGCLPNILVVATHGLFVGTAVERFRALPIRRLIVTNSVDRPGNLPFPIQEISLGPLLAEVIKRLHNNHSLKDLIIHG